MITKEELKEYAKMKGIKNLGYAEKDYFQIIILFILYQNYGTTLVFKGGTALNKCFGLDRYSEDLDFTSQDKIDIKKLEYGLKRFKIDFEIETKEYENELKIILRIKGPLYIGIKNSMCKLVIDISFIDKVILKPEIKTIGRFLEEIPTFDLFVMQEKEILAEKIRAILTRTNAKDIYDLWFLLKKGIEFDISLVKEKLKYYKKNWDFKEFSSKIKNKKTIWETELKPTVNNIPNFNKVKNYILDEISKYKKSDK